jgi:EmrB/QacA subfamily drug resistance transporter
MTTTREEPAAQLSHRQILVIFSGLMLGMLLAALDQTIVATALPTIVSELGGINHLSWVVTAYLLASTSSTPLYGKISDLFGRKIVFQTAIVIFLVGSALSGLAQNMAELIAFRGLQGLGAGGLIALAMAIIGDILSPRDRGRYQGYMGGVFGLASVAGPLLGGFFVDNLSWRWVFYINLPIGAVALLVTSVVLNLPFRRVRHSIDYLGAALLVAGVTAVLLVTVWGGDEYPWASPQVIGLSVAGVLLLTAFVVQERRAAEPILPPRLFRDPVFRVGSGLLFIVGLTMFGAIVFLPLYLQVVKGASATNSGLLLLPLMAGLLVSSITSGRLISHTGRYKVYPLVGTAVMTLGLFLLSRMDVATSRAQSSLFMVVLGLGIGLVMQVPILAIQNAVPWRDLGTATSAANFFRSMGGSFGVAIFGAVLSNRLAYYLPRLLPARALGDGLDPQALRASAAQLRALPPAVQHAVVETIARSVHVVFMTAVPLGALAFLVAVFLKELPLRRSAHIGADDVAESVALAAPAAPPRLDGPAEGEAPATDPRPRRAT